MSNEEEVGYGSTYQEEAFANMAEDTVKAEIYATGAALFGSIETFQHWMTAKNIALGGKKPLDLLPSRYGARLIFDVLGRIDSGAYS